MQAMRIIRGTIESYSYVSHTANVRPFGHPTAIMEAVPAVAHCPGEYLLPGQAVAVLVWHDVQALILGPYDALPLWPVSGTAQATRERAQSFPSSIWWDPDLSLELTINVPSHFWILWHATIKADQLDGLHQWVQIAYSDSAASRQVLFPASHVPCVDTGVYQSHNLNYRTAEAYPPDTYTFEVRHESRSDGYSGSIYHALLSILALPADPALLA